MIVLLAGYLVSGCGFQLRGQSTTLWPETLTDIYIRMGDQYSERHVYYLLRKKLSLETPVKIHDKAGTNINTLLLKSENIKNHVLTVNPDNATASSYLLRYRLVYELRDSNGVVILPSEHITLQRDYDFLKDNVLAGESRQADLLASLRKEAVDRLVWRLHHFRTVKKGKS